MEVRSGEVVTLLGRNGAGKTSTLKSIMGMIGHRTGSIRFEGRELIALSSDAIARAGIAFCPEERGIFASLGVEENLLLPPVVKPGEITTLLGANGAGKTTTLKAISGVLRSERGEVAKGSITLDGRRIDGMRAFDVTRLGVSQVFEGRRVFEHLTTEENLIAGGHLQRDGRAIRTGIERVFAYFPQLKERRQQLSGYLSGGEQQMLAIGRALMSEPKVILLDEPSLGLAPMLVEEIFAIVQRLVAQEKLAVLLVEQNAAMALAVAQRGYVMETGRIVLEGTVEALRANSDIREFYLGLNEVGSRKSYRDVKHYKRRKRWLS
jgi:branched-chain amino acid transport system ATP-binding protein